jgi:hypothetical protein
MRREKKRRKHNQCVIDSLQIVSDDGRRNKCSLSQFSERACIFRLIVLSSGEANSHGEKSFSISTSSHIKNNIIFQEREREKEEVCYDSINDLAFLYVPRDLRSTEKVGDRQRGP